MFTAWTDFDRNLAMMEAVRQRMARMFEEFEPGHEDFNDYLEARAWPRANVLDTGAAIVVRAEVPGLADKDVKLSFQGDVLTLSGTRTTNVPDNYAVLRQEREPLSFSRSFTFPCAIDAERATADLERGVLTVTLPKHPASQPRQITVKST